MLATGSLGAMKIVSASARAARTSGVGPGAPAPPILHAPDLVHRPALDQILLDVQIARRPVPHEDVCHDRIVGHGEHPRPNPQGASDGIRDLGRTLSLPQGIGAEDVGGKVAVPDPKPRR